MAKKKPLDADAGNPSVKADPPLASLAAESAGALSPSDSVQVAGDRMRELGTEKWPVVEDRKLVGMIEEKHPDRTIAAHGHDPRSWKVGEVMTREAVFCYEDQSCGEARTLMQEHDLQYLPVVDRAMKIVAVFSRDAVERAKSAS